ncbi:MAG: transmembrane sensor [Cellvibrionaceae bacterium]|jgi:transmembrane sensor
MKKVDAVENDSAILDQATEWTVELNSGELSEARTEMLHAWLKESPLHEASLLKVSDIWDETSALVAETKAVSSPRKNAWSFSSSMAVAAVIFVTLIGVLLSDSMNLNGDAQKPLAVIHETLIGEFKTVTLSDSSRVILNTNSRISVVFNEQSERRRIHLLQGEAYFDVAKDPLRPFVVNVDKREVRAVGTAFNIKSNTRYIEVLVKEGIVDFVDLSKSAEQNASPDRLTAGQILEIENGSKELSRLLPEKVEKRLSWQTGRVVFEGDKLKDVISEVSRYTKTQFIFSDEKAESISVGGSFRIGNVAELLDSIKEGFDVNVEERSDGTIVLSSSSL